MGDAAAVHAASLVIDGTTFFLTSFTDRLTRAGVTALNLTTAWPDDDLELAVRRIEDYYGLVAREPRLAIVERAEEIPRLKQEGRVGLVLAFQNARPIGTRLERVETFWRLGVRTIQLTYNERNFVGDGCAEATDAGLSAFGRALVRELNHAGIVIDLSHVGRRTSLEAIEASSRPCVFTHANPHALVPVPRNITDEQIKAVAAAGGVVGCSCFPPLVWRGDDRLPTLDDFIDCIAYVADLVGVDHVGIGTDSEATAGAYPTELRATLRARYAATVGTFRERFPDGRVEGLEDGMADWPRITARLLDRGFSAEDVQKINGGNFLRVFRQVWR
jgi:membrane dipeptidase